MSPKAGASRRLQPQHPPHGAAHKRRAAPDAVLCSGYDFITQSVQIIGPILKHGAACFRVPQLGPVVCLANGVFIRLCEQCLFSLPQLVRQRLTNSPRSQRSSAPPKSCAGTAWETFPTTARSGHDPILWCAAENRTSASKVWSKNLSHIRLCIYCA